MLICLLSLLLIPCSLCLRPTLRIPCGYPVDSGWITKFSLSFIHRFGSIILLLILSYLLPTSPTIQPTLYACACMRIYYKKGWQVGVTPMYGVSY